MPKRRGFPDVLKQGRLPSVHSDPFDGCGGLATLFTLLHRWILIQGPLSLLHR